MNSNIIELIDVSKKYGEHHALHKTSLTIKNGELITLLGPSGCGKTTLLRLISGLEKPDTGKILINGHNVTDIPPEKRHLNMIFQSYALFPHMTIYDNVAFGLRCKKIPQDEIQSRVNEILRTVKLEQLANRKPNQLSGGQQQRVAIARAIILNPKFIILDEPLSSLDVSIGAGIINLLTDLQKNLSLTYLFISHDLKVVKYISDSVSVLYMGKFLEKALTNKIFSNPLHPYTQALIDSSFTLKKNQTKILLNSEIPSLLNPPKGCLFSTRCPFAKKICFDIRPELKEIEKEHFVACHLVKTALTSLGSSKTTSSSL